MSSADASREWFDTIVVGAGVSGLAAARALTAAGQRVVVLEARDRIGGRLHSEREQGRVTDLGASWIHGITDSPVHQVTLAFGMRDVEFTMGSFQAGGRPVAYYGPDAQRLSDEAAAAFIADIAEFDTHLAQTVAQIAPNSSYEDAVEVTLTRLAWAAGRADRVREYLRHRTEEQYGVWISELDAHGLDDDETDGEEVVFPDGYDRLAFGLAAGLDIRLATPVSRVEWGSGGATVTAGQRTFAGARTVVTVPVGVLKSSEFVITPPLPEPVAGALERLEMNAFEKVFLRFPSRFWEDGVSAVRRQGDAGAWWHSWYDLTALHGEPTLLTFAAGPCAREIREWDDARVVDSVLTALREIYGDAVPDPIAAHLTHWQDDPWSRGSYAYMTVGSVPADHELLATPIGDVLHLAGEATWQEDPATITAALCSGHRAAERILNHAVPIASLSDPLPASAQD
ncbi:monoamine oxidase [Leucobacter luti]|uniref:Monoamine oxidase n=1 Tax=Leucobacter luti TaxID=340320 RepID=A0A4R6RWQ7_9MICO|nr:NAD(P)/FAD-dependent oxidoreductase [Leucobacter luti]TDP91479.1 monoamine oxidase [Leucobacter luti]